MSRIGRLPIDIPAKVKVEVKDRKVSVEGDRKSTRLNSSHSQISYAVLCLKKQKVRLEKAAITRQYPGARARAGTAEGEFASLHAAHRPAGLRDGRDIEREYALARPDMLAT